MVFNDETPTSELPTVPATTEMKGTTEDQSLLVMRSVNQHLATMEGQNSEIISALKSLDCVRGYACA